MADYWLDANALITVKRDAYGFDIAPGFWRWLEQQAENGRVACPITVYDEVRAGGEELAAWALAHKDAFFVEPSADVQAQFTQIADHVVGTYQEYRASAFLAGADPWLVAHAVVDGAKVVSFEAPARVNSPAVKIPDIAKAFGVDCISMWRMARELGLELR